MTRKNKKRNGGFGDMLKTLVMIGITAILAVFCVFKLYLAIQPPIKNLDGLKPNLVTQIYSEDGELIKTFSSYKYEDTDIKDVPQDLINALIATEDKNFYNHSGYDLFGLARSTIANFRAGKIVQGASTITQQLARMLFLTNERSYDRKIKEIIIAARIEKTLEKSKILEMYLNNVYLGSGAYGAAAASSIYFNKPLKDLTLSECALLAGLPQAPSVYSPFNNLKYAIERRNQVLLRMYKMKYITKENYEVATKAKVNLSPNRETNTLNRAPYFVNYVMKELEELGFDESDIASGGYKITTTLNYKEQEAAVNAVRKNLAAWGLTGKNNQGAVFSFSPIDGRILAYVGGKSYAQSQYDRVSQATRPPGSAFKPFVYATAVYQGANPDDLIDDSPVNIAGWAPKNAGNKYRGKITLTKALTVSSNVATVRLIQKTGIRPVQMMARELGITTPLANDYTIALGSNNVNLMDMVIAYGCFANGGLRVKPFSVLQVETSLGKVVYKADKTKINKVLDYKVAGTVNEMLKQVVKAGTGRAADIGAAQAGKTGTTDKCRDAWFVGYTPTIVTGVWIGNDDNSRLPGMSGGTVPARIWHDTMIVANEPYKNLDFDYPEPEKEEKLKPSNEEPEENVIDGEDATPDSEQPTEQQTITTPEPPKPELKHSNYGTGMELAEPKREQMNRETKEKTVNPPVPSINDTFGQKETTKGRFY